MKNRLISQFLKISLALMMAVTLLPANAFAEEVDDQIINDEIIEEVVIDEEVQNDEVVVETPVSTVSPDAVQLPDVTETPDVTEEPVVTETPVVTEEPVASETPVANDEYSETEDTDASDFDVYTSELYSVMNTEYEADEFSTDDSNDNPVIIVMSDYQNSSLSSSGKKTVPQTIVNALKDDGVTPELALIGGDYTDGSVGADGDDQSQANLKTELSNLTGILTTAWPNLPYYAIQGNHDYSGFLTDGTLTATGHYEKDDYVVYLINEDDYPWWQGNYGSGSSSSEDKATVTETANNLKNYLQTLDGTKPVIIMTHVPLHWSERSTASNWYYDNIYANILFEVINEAAENLDILVLFGHNHSSTASGGDYDSEIGGALAYVAKEESMKVPNGTDGLSNYTTEKLNFTYMNAGYVGKYAGSTEDCSIAALEITDTAININRYKYSGSVVKETIELNSQTTLLTDAETGITVKVPSENSMTVNEVSVDLLSNRVYKAYDIKLSNSLEEGQNAIVTLPAEGFSNQAKVYYIDGNTMTDMNAVISEGKATFQTNHFSVYAIAEPNADGWIELPEGNTTYTYTQATDITAGEEYVIVGNNHAVALLDDNGNMGSQNVTISGNTMTSTTALTEWTFSGSTSGTIYNGTRYLIYSNSSFSLNRNNSTKFTITDNGSNFRIQSGNYSFYYNGSSWTRSGRNTAQYVRLYQLTDTTTPQGGFARLTGASVQNYDVKDNTTITEIIKKLNIEMSSDGSSVSKTVSVTEDMISWNKDYDATSIGTYVGTIRYSGKELGTVTVNVSGSAEDMTGEGEWVSLGGSSGGYERITNLNQINSNEKYLVVVWRYFGENPNEEGYIFHDENNGNIKVSTEDGYETITSTSGTIDNGCYWYLSYNSNGTITMQNAGNNKYLGSNIVANSSNPVNLNIATGTYDGYQNFAIGYNDKAIRYSGSSGKFSFSDNSLSDGVSSANACNITIYKIVEETEESLARLTGTIEQVYAAGDNVSINDILGKVNVEISSDKNTVNEVVGVTSDMVTWDKTFDGSDAGVYTGTVTYKGKNLGTIKVTVLPVSVDKIELVEDSGSVIRGSVNSAITGGTIKVTYTDGSTKIENITLGMVNNDGKKEGTFTNLTVSYGGKTANGFTLTVIPRSGNNYPEYPNPGSVAVNKVIGNSSQFQEAGVAEVQLSTSGLPAPVGIDVVVVLDTSSSMQETVEGFSSNRLSILRPAVNSLIQQLQERNEDGSDPDIDISFVSFNGFTGNGNGSTTYGADDYIGAQAYATPNSGGWLTDKSGDGWVDVLDLDTNWADADKGNITTGSGTNYDEGLQMAYDLLSNKQGSWDEGEIREQFVVFMSDGAPFQYNGVYSNYNQAEWNNWLLGNYESASDIPDTVTHKEYYNDYANGKGQRHRIADAIKGSPEQEYQIVTYTADTNGTSKFTKVYGLGATMYSIGFLLADNGQVTDETQNIVLSTIASSEEFYFDVDTAEQLDDAFKMISSEVRSAATNAYYVDQMGSSFNLQTASSVVKFEGTDQEKSITLTPSPEIKVMSYNIYTKADVNETVSESMIGKRYGDPEVLEIVVFNDAGTEAYIKDPKTNDVDTTNNIMGENGVIDAKYFFYNNSKTTQTITLDNGDTYDLPAETFYWNIGTINMKEYVLSYYVYLDGSAEGKTGAGTYSTNNYATLHYTNWIGNDANQSVDSPAVAWESAAVYYGFYLVDANGNPIVNQTTGETGNFGKAVKITSKIFYDEVLLNDIESVGTTIQVVSTMVPEGYEVYDDEAKYTITIDSGKKISGWTIENGKSPDTTYVTDYSGVEYTNVKDSNKLENSAQLDYTATTVWFAVIWEPQCIDDTIVIDYGLPVDISVLGNDMFGENGELVGLSQSEKPKEVYTSTLSEGYTEQITDQFGVAALNGSKVRYTPMNMLMNNYDLLSYAVNYKGSNNSGYYYGNITVIPASTIYYEDNFTNGNAIKFSSFTWDYDSNSWSELNDENTRWKSISGDKLTQSEDRPGQYNLPSVDANEVYGYDSSYANMSNYSMNSVHYANVNYDNYAVVEFDFIGTGFDIISLTSNKTGTVFFTVYPVSNDGKLGEAIKKYTVDSYYGYTLDDDGNWVPSASDTENALYQVPLMKITDMTYGKYHVLVEAIYDPIFDRNQYGEDECYDFYLDAIRIYDPVNNGDLDNDGSINKSDSTVKTDEEIINNAYKADGEGWPTYFELRNHVIDQGKFDQIASDDVNGIVFIDGLNGTDSIEDYTNFGPNNELYLAKDQAISFTMDDIQKVEKIQIAVKTVGGSTTYKIYDVGMQNLKDATTYTLETSTDMYYDITHLNGKNVVIANTGENILSITNVKVTYTENPNRNQTESYSPFLLRRAAVNLALASLEPVVEEEIDTPDINVPEVDPETPEVEPETPNTGNTETTTPETGNNNSTTEENTPSTGTTAPEAPEGGASTEGNTTVEGTTGSNTETEVTPEAGTTEDEETVTPDQSVEETPEIEVEENLGFFASLIKTIVDFFVSMLSWFTGIFA